MEQPPNSSGAKTARRPRSPWGGMDDVGARLHRDTPVELASGDVRGWSDAALVDAIRAEIVNERALDVLVDRHWKTLFSRCRMLTQTVDEATDLSQSAWYRVLRARRSLDPTRSFAAYLATTATNLWRDSARAAHRAGPLAAHRLDSLDAPLQTGHGPSVMLVDMLADPQSHASEDRVVRAVDIDRALARLKPRLREVLIARFLDGESTADIARREGRSEQSVNGWIREALAEMKVHLGHRRRDTDRGDEA